MHRSRAKVNPLTYIGIGVVILVMIALKMADLKNSFSEFIIPGMIGVFGASYLSLFTHYSFDGKTLTVKALFAKKQVIPIKDIPKIEYRRINLLGQIISGSPKEVLVVYYTKYDSTQILLPLSHPLVKAVEAAVKEKAKNESTEVV